MTGDQEADLMARLAAIHARVGWMGSPEARSAWAQSTTGHNDLLRAKGRLVEEAERVLNQIERIGVASELSQTRASSPVRAE